ncbi:[3-methyl-2-oxobutanoate dehydrogenase [lipoamide]] kinase, mitochondrial [Zancudomyces culisetae]|uniref:Protein-serine/threonine kinase n=1 Tax=Zancudomyces culisetae TaxID=1213189 RepID=A0A1R1PW30_ZANCU|nr:[3-methyl-2-oxobutanoate dehydrogenase [lipoamide]] kinase, mitochondrial [Zancudomyces culisetae]|eukprot:OMH85161.1 [3-methyl-2-oxobutanoate dehydrogenase [lipoamide]] kinase, mitochondrial [Zancudomyces culisetae]
MDKQKDAGEWVGSFHTKINLSQFIQSCCSVVEKMCMDLYSMAPKVSIIDTQNITMCYLPNHLEYMLIELLKNAFRATCEVYILNPEHAATDPSSSFTNTDSDTLSFTTESDTNNIQSIPFPAISITLSADSQFVGIKISDQGGGIGPKTTVSKVFEYSFSTYQDSSETLFSDAAPLGMMDQTSSLPSSQLAGMGFGLPLTRLYAQYLGGSLDLVSMNGLGCDVFLKLPIIDLHNPSLDIYV